MQRKTEFSFLFASATNHLGHFLLVNLLLNHIISCKENVRIINVASDTHNPEEKTGMPDPRIPPQMVSLAYPERDNDPERPKEDAAATGRRNYTYAARSKKRACFAVRFSHFVCVILQDK